MKSKTSADHKKQTIVVKDLKTRKNPKGGGTPGGTIVNDDHGLGAKKFTANKSPAIFDRWGNL